MTKQKQPVDSRDVFEKALDDYAPAVSGALIGGMIGRAAGRIPKEKLARLEQEKFGHTLEFLEGKTGAGRLMSEKADAIADLKGRRTGRMLFGATTGGATGAYYSEAKRQQEKRNRRKK